ncbi:hypothetical protein AAVH_05819 [Aphelenchoides avenae]|nr:hypothetical protein AAVH_05819 [Aphelenchus avenae]
MSTGAENDPYDIPSVPTWRDFSLPVDDPFNQTLGDRWFDLQKDKVSSGMAQLAVQNVPEQPAQNASAAESRPPLAQHNAPERSTTTSTSSTNNGPTAKPARRYSATRQAQSLAAKRRSASVNNQAAANVPVPPADTERQSRDPEPGPPSAMLRRSNSNMSARGAAAAGPGPSSRAAPSGLQPRRPSGVAQRSGSAVGRRRSSSASGAQRPAALPPSAPTTRRPSAVTRRSGAVPPPPKTRSSSTDKSGKVGASGISIAAKPPATTLPMPYSLRTRNPQTGLVKPPRPPAAAARPAAARPVPQTPGTPSTTAPPAPSSSRRSTQRTAAEGSVFDRLSKPKYAPVVRRSLQPGTSGEQQKPKNIKNMRQSTDGAGKPPPSADAN